MKYRLTHTDQKIDDTPENSSHDVAQNAITLLKMALTESPLDKSTVAAIREFIQNHE